MLYVVDTPSMFGNDDKVYGIDGHISFPKIEDLEAAVELWAQFYGMLHSELTQGGTSSLTRWSFWSQHFKPQRMFFDYDRLFNLFNVYLPFGATAQMLHQGALWQNVNPLASYPDFCAQNALFQNADGSEQFIRSAFPAGCFFNSSSSTSPLSQLFGTHPFVPNQALLIDDIVQMWRNLKNVCNPHIYMLVPEINMFYHGSYGQPFDYAYNAASSYERRRKTQHQNNADPDAVVEAVLESGYTKEAFSIFQSWSRTATSTYDDATSDPEGYYHYEWDKTVDYLAKTNSDNWLWKNVPIPSTLYGENVPLSRSLLSVWRVDYLNNITRSQSGTTSQTYTWWYLSKQDYTKGDTRQFTDLDNVDYGLCQQWRFPWEYFNSFFAECMDQAGWISPDDQQLGWGDMSTHQETSDYITYQNQTIEIRPVYFYSMQESKATQDVLFPVD